MVTHTFLPKSIGGRENHVYYLSKELIRKGFDVCVFTNSWNNHVSFETYDGIPTCRFPFVSVRVRSNNDEIPYRITNPSVFIKLMQTYSPDIVHAHDYRHFTSDLAAIYSRIYNKPFLLTIHGFFYKTGSLFKAVMAAYDKTLGKLSLKTANKIICVSNQLAQQRILKDFRSKIVVVPNGVPFDLMPLQLKNYDYFKQRFGIRRKMILAVGRLTYQKGFQYLIKAYRMIMENGDESQLCIVGPEADYGSELKRLAGDTDSIIFTGSLPVDELKQAYNSADLFVLSSLSEGCPLTLLEAMSFGKPVIATSVGMIPDVIQDRVNGIRIPPGDSEYLAKTIKEVLFDDCLAKRMGEKAKARSTELWAEFISQTKQIYGTLLGEVN